MGEVKAKIKYLPNTYEILEKGDYVECAVSNKKIPWTILRVVKTSMNSAVLKPLNRKRSLSQLSGQKVSFLEFN